MEKVLLTSPPIKQIIQSSETSYIKPIHSLESPLLQGSVPPKDAEIPTSSNNRYIGQEKAIGFPIAISIKKVLSGGQPGAPFPSPPRIKQVIPSGLSTEGDEPSEKNGDYLLSHCYA
ncbi:hypothetical protein ACIXFY_21070, partial [Bacteroides fragilis]